MIELSLSKDIYALSDIEKAIADFSELAKAECKESGEHYICSFYDFKYAPEETIHEFENYLIDLSNQ